VTGTARRLATGAGWLYAYRWVERLLDLLAVLVLARILSPEDFGLVAIATSFVSIIEGLSAFDVNKALIRARDDEEALYDTAWTLSVLRGLASAACLAAIVPFLTDARLQTVVLTLALSPLLSGLSNPRFVVFERDLVYSRLAVLTLGARVASFGVTLLVAFLYRSYWALVLGLLTGTLVSVLLSYALKPHRPRIATSRFSEIFAFSGWLSLASVVTTLSMETDRIIVGKLLGFADAGLYFMTQRVGVLPTRELISPLQRALFPSFSALADDRLRLRRAVTESVNVLGSLSLPAGCGFALVANDFVPLALGDQWTSIVPLLTILVPYLGFRGTLSMTLPCVMALGRTRLLFRVSLAYALVHLPAFVAGTALFSLRGSIVSIVAAGGLYWSLNAWLLRKTLGISLSEIAAQIGRPLLGVALMAAAIGLLDAASPLDLFSPRGSWVSLSVKMLIGGAVFTGVCSVVWRLQGRPAGIERRILQLISR
jgi:PST family polysaccharide transporter